MRGHCLKIICIIINVSVLLGLLLYPGISHAVEFHYIKQIPEPVPPDIKCGEPGEDPNFNTLSMNGFSDGNYEDTETLDVITDDNCRNFQKLIYFVNLMRFVFR